MHSTTRQLAISQVHLDVSTCLSSKCRLAKMRIRRSGGTANTDVTSIEVEAAASKVRAQMIEDEKIRPEHESKVTGLEKVLYPGTGMTRSSFTHWFASSSSVELPLSLRHKAANCNYQT